MKKNYQLVVAQLVRQTKCLEFPSGNTAPTFPNELSIRCNQ